MLVNAVENQVIPRYQCHTARVPLKVCRYSPYNLEFQAWVQFQGEELLLSYGYLWVFAPASQF